MPYAPPPMASNSSRFAGMQATYDPEADALYLYVCNDRPNVGLRQPVSERINADLTLEGQLIGWEILGVSTLPRPDRAEEGGESSLTR